MKVLIDGVVFTSDRQVIDIVKRSVSDSNWTVGQAAAVWCRKRPGTLEDSDFASLVGLTSESINQRRRVWEQFGDVRERFPVLYWSHFWAAIDWDDAAECLQWANDIQATVAEMKAWRRAQRGDDLSDAVEELA